FSTTVAGGPFDLVIAGQLLSELDREMDPAERVKKHVRLARTWLEGTNPDGALVVVEPALRDRSRHLQTVRDVFTAERMATVFAPCLHQAACPALVRETDWCSEDRPIDLPTWLVPVAKAAGLRWEGSTFAYLVLRRDGVSLGQRLSAHPTRFRAVSDAIETKGKSEFFLCGVMLGEGGDFEGRLRVTRLDRHETPDNEAWSHALRGDLIAIVPPPALRGQKDEARIDGATQVKTLDPKEGA
ncbi:MAG TPA: small ribosomal subunit Rsm22 family protein, partial [Polyangiaceae bacterium]